MWAGCSRQGHPIQASKIEVPNHIYSALLFSLRNCMETIMHRAVQVTASSVTRVSRSCKSPFGRATISQKRVTIYKKESQHPNYIQRE
jgi:hypothetical protein